MHQVLGRRAAVLPGVRTPASTKKLSNGWGSTTRIMPAPLTTASEMVRPVPRSAGRTIGCVGQQSRLVAELGCQVSEPEPAPLQ